MRLYFSRAMSVPLVTYLKEIASSSGRSSFLVIKLMGLEVQRYATLNVYENNWINGCGRSLVITLLAYSNHEKAMETTTSNHSNTESLPRTGTDIARRELWCFENASCGFECVNDNKE